MSSSPKRPKRAAPRRRPPQARRKPDGDDRSQSGERLQKVIAAAGLASRRAAEQLIDEGRVTVDGKVVRIQGMRVDPARVRVEVDGARVNVSPRHEYILLNKPRGVVTTVSDPRARHTVVDLVRSKKRVYPVGRLDADTLGLVLLTDHGELTHRLTHPSFQIPRRYAAEVRGNVSREATRRLLDGVRLEDGVARAKAIRVRRRAASRSLVEITMTEGRKHEVRRMFDAVGFPVLGLVRIGFGPLVLGDLASGESRRLTAEEVGRLLAAVDL